MRMKANFLLAGVVAGALVSGAWATDFSVWSYKAAITFPGYTATETLTNFPVLVVLSNNCFPGFNYRQFRSGSNDLSFTSDATGLTNLNYEIESWNPSGVSYVWVQMPALSNASSLIYAYWGNPAQTTVPSYGLGAVWSNNYIGVYHMNQTNVVDSSGIISTGTSVGNTNATGRFGGGQGFSSGGVKCSGAGSHIALPVASLNLANGITNFPNGFTLSAWIYPTSAVTSFHYGVSDTASRAYNEGADWVGVLFAI